MVKKQRQLRILHLLQQTPGLQPGALAKRLKVSRMTIHRDLHQLQQQNKILRLPGLAMVPAGGRSHTDLVPKAVSSCAFCDREVLPHQSTGVQQANELQYSCCLTCALCHLPPTGNLQPKDLLTGQLLQPQQACFLLKSLLKPCCTPSILAFASCETGQLFQDAFGGILVSLGELQEFLSIDRTLV